MRTIIIGDIHGCARTLDLLLREVRPDPAQDMLIFLGDLFDRGPDAWQVWQQVQQLKNGFGSRLVLLRGNHEDYWLKEKPSLRERILHDRVGKRATEMSFIKREEDIRPCLAWLREHVIDYYESPLFQCVHAGIRDEMLRQNDPYTMFHDHDCVLQNAYAGRLTITGHIALDRPTWFAGDGARTLQLQENMVYTLPDRGLICIDTGCGKNGALTAMVIEQKYCRLFTVPQLEVI